jgi:hypothetical protein
MVVQWVKPAEEEENETDEPTLRMILIVVPLGSDRFALARRQRLRRAALRFPRVGVSSYGMRNEVGEGKEAL